MNDIICLPRLYFGCAWSSKSFFSQQWFCRYFSQISIFYHVTVRICQNMPRTPLLNVSVLPSNVPVRGVLRPMTDHDRACLNSWQILTRCVAGQNSFWEFRFVLWQRILTESKRGSKWLKDVATKIRLLHVPQSQQRQTKFIVVHRHQVRLERDWLIIV